jgi:putative transposase
MMSPTRIIQIIKSMTAKENFKLHQDVKEKFWDGEFWTIGYYVNKVEGHGDDNGIQAYMKAQRIEKE